MKHLIILSIVFSFLVAGIVLAIPNPAPIYCQNMGYTYNDTSCIFNANQSCEIWSFYNGKCGQEFVKKLDCIKLGGALSPGYKCCEGLKSGAGLSTAKINSEGECDFAVGSFGTCIACGDGKCDSQYENVCNCEKDCKNNNSMCQTDSDCPVLNCYGDKCPVYKCIEGKCQNANKPQTKNFTIIKEIIRSCKDEGLKECEKEIKKIIIGKEDNITKMIVKNISAKIEGEIEDFNNKTYFKIKNITREIKIMPDTASKRAIARLKLKVCSEANNCTIILKDTGIKNMTSNETKLIYEIKAMKEKRFLFWKWKTEVKTEIDAESGN